MRIYFFSILFFFSSLLGKDFYDQCEFYEYNNVYIDVVQFNDDLVKTDVYLRYFKDLETKLPRYLFQFHNFPKEEEITVSIQRVAQRNKDDWRPIYKFFLKPSGMILDEGNPIGFKLCFSSQGCLPGERINFCFAASSGFKKTISFIPNPLSFKSRAGNTLLKAELLSIDPTSFKIEFPGLKPKEKLRITSLCEGLTKGPIKHTASEPLIFSPDNEESQGGISLLTVGRISSQKIKMELPWGNELLKYYSIPKFFHP